MHNPLDFKIDDIYYIKVRVKDVEKFSNAVFHLVKGIPLIEGMEMLEISWDKTKASKILEAIKPIRELIVNGEI